MSDTNILRVRVYSIATILTLAIVFPVVGRFLGALVEILIILGPPLVAVGVAFKVSFAYVEGKPLLWKDFAVSTVQDFGKAFTAIDSAVLSMVIMISLIMGMLYAELIPASAMAIALALLLFIAVSIIEPFLLPDKSRSEAA